MVVLWCFCVVLDGLYSRSNASGNIFENILSGGKKFRNFLINFQNENNFRNIS